MGGLMQAPACYPAPVVEKPMGSVPIPTLQTEKLKPREGQGLV